jgi:hypothetical protein
VNRSGLLAGGELAQDVQRGLGGVEQQRQRDLQGVGEPVERQRGRDADAAFGVGELVGGDAGGAADPRGVQTAGLPQEVDTW